MPKTTEEKIDRILAILEKMERRARINLIIAIISIIIFVVLPLIGSYYLVKGMLGSSNLTNLTKDLGSSSEINKLLEQLK